MHIYKSSDMYMIWRLFYLKSVSNSKLNGTLKWDIQKFNRGPPSLCKNEILMAIF